MPGSCRTMLIYFSAHLIGTGAAVRENKPYTYGHSKFEAGELAALGVHLWLMWRRWTRRMWRRSRRMSWGMLGFQTSTTHMSSLRLGWRTERTWTFDEFAEVGFIFLPPDRFEKWLASLFFRFAGTPRKLHLHLPRRNRRGRRFLLRRLVDVFRFLWNSLDREREAGG